MTVVFEFTQDQLLGMTNEHPGGCTQCGEYAEGVEPDASGYECENCGADAVEGIDNLMMRDMVEVI